MHPFRVLRENHEAAAEDYAKILAEGTVFHTPVLVRALEGRDLCAMVYAATPAAKETGAFVGEWKLDDRSTFLYWRGETQGREMESLEILIEDETGLIVERTVAYRPLPAIQVFRRFMYPRMKDKLPPDVWAYPGEAFEL